MSPQEGLSSGIVATVKSAELASLSQEYAEIALDSALSDGVLKDIPVVGTIVAIGKIGASISDRVFTRKLLRFLTSLSEISTVDRESMINRLDQEASFRSQVGDRIIELLDRIDSYSKPEMLARSFRAYAKQSIDGSMLNRLSHAIQQLPHFEISTVRTFHDATLEQRMEISVESLGALTAAGLANPTSGFGRLVYEPSEVCKAFVKLNIDR